MTEPTPTKPRPDQLWEQARREHPNDRAARRIRYVALMREHGHLLPTLPGQPLARTAREFFACDLDAIEGES